MSFRQNAQKRAAFFAGQSGRKRGYIKYRGFRKKYGGKRAVFGNFDPLGTHLSVSWLMEVIRMAAKKELDFQNDVVPVLLEYLSSLKYGSITLVVQDNKIVQIEKNEKIRF